MKIGDKLEREFYEKQAVNENWSVRELMRQKNAHLFLRLAASKDKEGILELSKKGQIIQKPADIFREPYVFDFLKIPEPRQFSETDLESGLINNLQKFLLELGKGFAFVGRQYRISIDNSHYYIDLVFYHVKLKCFVLVDLKRRIVGYEDIGQMNMYLGYFAEEETVEGDNPPIGIVLAEEKSEMLVRLATYGMSAQLFVKQYGTHLPSEEQLRGVIEATLNPKPRVKEIPEAN